MSASACHLVSTTPSETQIIPIDRLTIWLQIAGFVLSTLTTKKTDDLLDIVLVT